MSATKGGGGGKVLTLADKGGEGGLATAEITDKMAKNSFENINFN